MDSLTSIKTFIIIYLVMINVFSFVAFGIDKARAVHRMRRIPERRLWWFTFAGGSVGALAGMSFFRHKTKHTKFIIGVPVVLALQIAVILLLVCFNW